MKEMVRPEMLNSGVLKLDLLVSTEQIVGF